MDINSLRAISTVLVTVAFVGVCWWAFAPQRRAQFEEAARLPFADEVQPKAAVNNGSDQNKKQGDL